MLSSTISAPSTSSTLAPSTSSAQAPSTNSTQAPATSSASVSSAQTPSISSTPTPSTSSKLHINDIEITKLKFKLEWLATDISTFQKRFALQKFPLHDGILINDITDALHKAKILHAQAAEMDFELGKLFHEQIALLRSIYINAAHNSFFVLPKISNIYTLSIVITEKIIKSETISALYVYPTEASHLAFNDNHLIKAEQEWNQFVANYQELSKQPLPSVEDFHINIKNHIRSLKVQYNMNFAEYRIRQYEQGKAISKADFKEIRKSLKQAKKAAARLPNATDLQQKIKNLRERLQPSQQQNNTVINTTPTNRSSTLNTLNGLYQSNGQTIPFDGVEIAAEKEYFCFNEIKLVNEPENYQPSKFVGIDLDETLILSFTNGTFQLIAEDKLIAFLKELDSSIKVSIITTRYYPEGSDLIKAQIVANTINQKVGRPIISSIIYTNARDKMFAMSRMEKRYFYMSHQPQRSNLSHTDDRDEILTGIAHHGFKAIKANLNGDHIAELREFVGLPNATQQLTASSTSAIAQATTTPTPMGR